MRAVWAVLVGGILSAAPALAESPLDIQVQSQVLLGKGKPTIRVTALRPVKALKVTLTDPTGRGRVVSVPALGEGQVREIPIDQKPGTVSWKVEFTWAGATEPEAIAFDAVVSKPLEIRISKDTVDLADGRIAFVPSEPIARVTLVVEGESGQVLTELDQVEEVSAGQVATVEFPPPAGAVAKVRLTVYDRNGFFNGVEIAPYFVEIPHEEVTFESGSAEVRPAEEPKLTRTLGEVRKALKKFGNEFKARLYVAGYTDTVGSRESNQELSDRRAQAIARWFQGHSLEVRVCSQGFGEDALAVATPDETPEARNRRTIHVLGNQAPAVSKVFPRSAWRCL